MLSQNIKDVSGKVNKSNSWSRKEVLTCWGDKGRERIDLDISVHKVSCVREGWGIKC